MQGESAPLDVSAYASTSDFAPAAFNDTHPEPMLPPVLTLVPPPGPPVNRAAAATARAPISTAPGRTDSAAPRPHAQDSTIEAIKAELEKRHRMFIVIALEGARRALVEGDELTIEYAPEAKHLRDNLAKPESVKLLREVCRAVTGRDLGVRIAVKEQGAEDDGQSSKQEQEQLEKKSLREFAEQHSFTQEVLNKFRAEVVDVQRIDSEK
jgi:hypothetical protein